MDKEKIAEELYDWEGRYGGRSRLWQYLSEEKRAPYLAEAEFIEDMILTKKSRNRIALELWEWLAETGKLKEEWPEWEKYGKMGSDCPFCEYDHQQSEVRDTEYCKTCPIKQKYDDCYGTYFFEWDEAETIEDRKKYGTLFLEQLKEIL